MEERIGKVRIGNDIMMRVQFNNASSHEGEELNIQSVEAYIINSTKQNELVDELEKKTKFISRFPVEPYVDAYSSTAYDVKSSGYPTWRAYPHNHVYGTYSGFGTSPNWKYLYRRMPEHNLTEYKAQVRYTKDRNVVEVFFPAEAQLYTGTYDLVLVAKVFEPGYFSNNLRTITMDYSKVVTIVGPNEDGATGNIELSVSQSGIRGNVLSIEIYGTSTIGIGGTADLAAKVLPVDAANTDVEWSIDNKDVFYLVITSKDSRTCRCCAISKPEGEDSHKATVIATAKDGSGKKGLFEIEIRNDLIGDLHVSSGQVDGETQTLTLTNGLTVEIPLGEASGWHDDYSNGGTEDELGGDVTE